MSMITGCPACGTMFRVVPDQLKISEGWVRCGHCAEVFDAAAHMQPDAVLQAQPVAAAAPGAAVGAAPGAERAALASAAPTEASMMGPDQQADPAPDLQTHPEVQLPPAGPSLTPWHSPSGFGPSSLSPEEHGYLPLHLVREEADAAAAHLDAQDALDAQDHREPDEAEDLPLEDVTFVRDARRKAFWRRPAVRVALVLGSLALAGLLAAQVAVHERDRLAALDPQALPLLERLCRPLGCRVGPPRRIEAIAIDSSGFTKLRPDTYRLSVTLKNQAQAPVAVPALELTLTDSQDQPLLRRVLTPGELGAPADTIAAAADWSASVAIAVGGASAARVAGYRLLAFYP
jgi:predicted Zn finger-like uncharacterized protein